MKDSRMPVRRFWCPVVLVCGSIGSGKTTFVRERRKPGDLVVDLDAILAAITFEPWYSPAADLCLPIAWRVRDLLVAQLQESNPAKCAWVVSADPDIRLRHTYEQFGAKVIVLETPSLVAIERVRNDPHRKQKPAELWVGLISDWWAKYRARSGDVVIHES